MKQENILCECSSEELAYSVEEKFQEIVRQKGKLIHGSDRYGCPVGSDISKRYIVYATILKANLYQCPMSNCSVVRTEDGIKQHLAADHHGYAKIKRANELLRLMEVEPLDVEITPKPVSFNVLKLYNLINDLL